MWNSITASAGPFSNLVLALFCVVLFGVRLRMGVLEGDAVQELLAAGFQLNVLLAVFNMLPFPPLDGSRVAEGLLPAKLRPAWDRFARFGPLAVLAVVLLLPRMGFDVMRWTNDHASRFAASLVQAIESVGT